jgi:hypothetical protein
MDDYDNLIFMSRALNALLIIGPILLLAVFIVLCVVRYWYTRATKRSPSSGLDLEELQRQRDEGKITQEEYNVIYTRLSGIASGGSAARQPIKGTGDASPFGFAQGGQGGKGSTDGEK